MKTSILKLGAFAATLVAFTVGCASSGPKASISDNIDPAQESAAIESEINQAYTEQLDVLAPKEFGRATAALDEARERIQDAEPREKVTEQLALSRGNLQAAREIAQGRMGRVQGIAEARLKALQAGARQQPKQDKRLKDLDDDFRDLAEDKEVDPKDFANLKAEYMELELAAIQSTQLGQAKAKLAAAKANGAKENLPDTLNKTELAITNAESAVAANRNSEDVFAPAVKAAVESATLLEDALAVSKRPDGTTASEEVSLQIVKQNRALTASQAEASSNGQIARLEKVLESARQQFNSKEAEVYRQGDKLIVRLKDLKFETGKNDLPARSIELLAKVRTVAESLNPSEVLVEGHTDSVGGEKVNLKLSQARAEAVATYLSANGIDSAEVHAVGMGYKKPLASNKSKSGRAQNRRVDVIVTPGASADSAKAEEAGQKSSQKVM